MIHSVLKMPEPRLWLLLYPQLSSVTDGRVRLTNFLLAILQSQRAAKGWVLL